MFGGVFGVPNKDPKLHCGVLSQNFSMFWMFWMDFEEINGWAKSKMLVINVWELECPRTWHSLMKSLTLWPESMNTLQVVTLFTSGMMLWASFVARLADGILPFIMGCLYASSTSILSAIHTRYPGTLKKARHLGGFKAIERHHTNITIWVYTQKKGGNSPKWMMNYNGKAYFLMDDLGGKPIIFRNTLFWRWLQRCVYPDPHDSIFIEGNPINYQSWKSTQCWQEPMYIYIQMF